MEITFALYLMLVNSHVKEFCTEKINPKEYLVCMEHINDCILDEGPTSITNKFCKKDYLSPD